MVVVLQALPAHESLAVGDMSELKRTGPGEALDQLIQETRELDAKAKAVQGEQELLVTEDAIEELVDAYHRWYARALTVLPGELHEKFRDLYEGGLVVKRIKSFLEAPAEVSQLFSPDQEAGLFPYWHHPYETTFHSSLLEQRQLLTLAKQVLEEEVSTLELEVVEQLGRGFPALVDALTHRYNQRPAFDVNDEYDVQDLIGGVLRQIFEDVRPEDPSPTRGGGSSRVDFVLKRERIVVEIKMTRRGLGDRGIGNQLIQDIERYRSHPDCGALVAIVYDPDRHIRNPRGLEEDLGGDKEGLIVRVIICS